MVNDEEKYYEPPGWVLRCLQWFCADRFLEEVEGDLWECYQEEVATYGERWARWRFAGMSMRYMRPYFFDSNHLKIDTMINSDMLRHFGKTAGRQLWRQRFYAATNIVGFAVGLAACLLIGLYVQHETSYDQHHANADQLYHVSIRYNIEGRSGHTEVVPPPMAGTMLAEVPEVTNAVRLAPTMYDAGSNQVRTSEMTVNTRADDFVYADASMVEMFSHEWLYGQAEGQLQEPYTVVVTVSEAERLFGKRNPVGEQLILNDDTENSYRVTGVIADLPSNTHLEYKYLLSMESTEAAKQDNWGFSNFLTYLELVEGADLVMVEQKLLAAMKRNNPELAEVLNAGSTVETILTPVADVHLGSSEINGYWQHGNTLYIRLFAGVALFILLLAGINFVNLATARASLRGLEIGLRKVLGSVRRQLVVQFLVEAVVVSALALMLAVGLAAVSMPFFNKLTELPLALPWSDWRWWGMLGLAPLVLGLLAGAYPAIYMAAYEPLRVLKGYLSRGKGARRFRSQLVVFQFSVAVALIAATLVIRGQLTYLQQRELGYAKEQVLVLESTHTLDEKLDILKERLTGLPEVDNVSVGGFLPVEGYFRNGCSTWLTGEHEERDDVPLEKWYVDNDYVQTLGMEILQGRAFSDEFPSDSLALVLNETAVQKLGLTDPVGAKVSSYTYMDSETGELYHEDYTVIGVVKDFHYESLHKDIGGLSMVRGGGSVNTVLRYTATDTEALLRKVDEVWQEVAGKQPLQYAFLDDSYAAMYSSEQRTGRLFMIFTGLAILVACLGLFALVNFIAEQRRREIGVRKVLGATPGRIVWMMTKPFALLVLIAIILAVPLAWWGSQQWLAAFAYRAPFNVWYYVLAGGMALVLAMLTMSYQAWRAAIVNPAETIKMVG